MSASTETMESKANIRCLVIQLARLGDTLQSLMALRAAKQLYPQLEIHFLAREKFAHAAQKVSWIKNVITLPTDDILGPILAGEKTETEALADVAQWIAPIIKDPWDMVINWSFSDASSYLTGLLPSRIKLGYTRRADTSFAGADGWSHYMQAIVQGKIGQNIHLTDILTTQLLTALQIHAGDPHSDGNAPVTSKGFFSLSLNERELGWFANKTIKKWIAFQIGAGQKSKTWDQKHWSQFILYFIKRHPDYGIFLLGGKEDIDRAKYITDEISPFIKNPQALVCLVGETSFDHWASVISRCLWLVAGDTAAIHLASVLGTRILNISIGPVRHNETGPYGNGHYLISSGLTCQACQKVESTHVTDHSCGNDVTPEAVYATWSYAANEWAHRRQISVEAHFSTLNWSDRLNSVRIYRSRIRNTSDGGGVVFDSMTKRPLEIEEWTAMVVGQMARSWYCGWTPPIGQEITRNVITAALIQKLRELQSSTDVLIRICEKANRTALSLNQKSSTLKSEKLMGIRDREELRELGKALLDLEVLIERLAKTHVPLRAFAEMSKVLLHNLKGTQLSELGKETAACYRQLHDGVTLFREWIKFTMDLAKPMAIRPAPALAKEITP
jgi:heptosyltransferase-1